MADRVSASIVLGGTISTNPFAEPTRLADEHDYGLIGRHKADRLGSIEAIRARHDAADFVLPPLIVAGRSR